MAGQDRPSINSGVAAPNRYGQAGHSKSLKENYVYWPERNTGAKLFVFVSRCLFEVNLTRTT